MGNEGLLCSYLSGVCCIYLCTRALDRNKFKSRNAPAMMVMMFGLEAEATQETQMTMHSDNSAIRNVNAVGSFSASPSFFLI